MRGYMKGGVEGCSHPRGLRPVSGPGEGRCPVCEERLGIDDVARWVREAEGARDEACSMDSVVEGDGFTEIVREERQREVYQRRKMMYELQSAPRTAAARPEMLLVIHDASGARDGSYECRVFYKEPRPAWGIERLDVEAGVESIQELHSHPDPTVRLASGKVEEFHNLRRELQRAGSPAPTRRVFYASEL